MQYLEIGDPPPLSIFFRVIMELHFNIFECVQDQNHIKRHCELQFFIFAYLLLDISKYAPASLHRTLTHRRPIIARVSPSINHARFHRAQTFLSIAERTSAREYKVRGTEPCATRESTYLF